MAQRESAICVQAVDYSETSQVVHFLTRGWGMVRLLAKGSKRPKSKTGGAIDLLSEGDLVFIASSRESLGTLVEFTETVRHSGMRQEASRLNAGLYAIELIGLLLAEADPHVEVFDLLHNTLGRLDEADCPWPAVLAYYQWRLLKLAGLLGELAACASCGREIAGRGRRDMHFSSTAGGLLCGACEGSATEKYRLDGRTTAGIAAMAAAEAGKKVLLPAPQAQAVNRLLLYHVTQQTGKAPRMGRHAIP